MDMARLTDSRDLKGYGVDWGWASGLRPTNLQKVQKNTRPELQLPRKELESRADFSELAVSVI
jgi:hypothetical protein